MLGDTRVTMRAARRLSPMMEDEQFGNTPLSAYRHTPPGVPLQQSPMSPASPRGRRSTQDLTRARRGRTSSRKASRTLSFSKTESRRTSAVVQVSPRSPRSPLRRASGEVVRETLIDGAASQVSSDASSSSQSSELRRQRRRSAAKLVGCKGGVEQQGRSETVQCNGLATNWGRGGGRIVLTPFSHLSDRTCAW